MNIQAVIFDMDGLLIDSEPIWREAEVRVFNACGIPLVDDDCRQTMGLRIDEVVQYWAHRYPEVKLDAAQIAKDVVREVIANIQLKGEPLPGVREALQNVKDMNLKIALASSSAYDVINAVVDKFGIREYFEVIYSAQDEQFGKPHPAVYLTTAQKMHIDPAHCVALEDSLNGVISAKAAKMKCIAIPELLQRERKEFGVADQILDSLDQLSKTILQKIF